ncbi:MAG: branched-chain amino acid ABC transporter permease [Actinobacteria bacterium]|nr:MAG: branched-chain amino acid ABC transporter permease [Actinomycetota bacterium]
MIGIDFLEHLRERPWMAWPIGAVLAWLLVAFVLPKGAPLGVVLTGAVFGTATALLAMGLILVYRATRIINFAQVGLGGVGGILAVNLFLHQGWPYFLCLALGVVVGIGVGALVDVAVIRRFRNASRLLLTVATIGLAQVLGGLELLIPKWVGAGSPLNGGYSTPVSSVHVNIAPVIITGDHLLIVAVVPVVIAVLAWFLLRTDNGVAVRAAAENADRALLLGIPVRRLSTLVWAIAGGLSALTFVLRARRPDPAAAGTGGRGHRPHGVTALGVRGRRGPRHPRAAGAVELQHGLGRRRRLPDRDPRRPAGPAAEAQSRPRGRHVELVDRLGHPAHPP